MVDTSTENSTAAAPPAPELKLVFTSNVEVDASDFRLITSGAGSRTNVSFKGGHWKHPDGTIFANVVPGVGGEFGIIDPKGIFRPDIKYTVQFDDGKFGHITATGHGIIKVGNTLSVRVETDSEKYSYLAGKTLLCPGVFVGHSVVSSTYLPNEHWTK